MSEKYPTTRRRYLTAAGAAGVIGVTGLPGTVGALQAQPIQMGSILPITGDLSAFGSGMQEAVNLAVQDINDGGGPLDQQINMSNRDSETRPEAGVQRYQSLVNEQNIIGFVGAASSGVSVPLAENVAADQVMQVSNASTSPVLAELGFNEDQSVKYFARTAPNDAQQGIVMGRIIGDEEYVGAQNAAFLYVDNPYGEGLAQRARENFEGETVGMVGYDQRATDYTSTLDELYQNDPEAVGFIGYPGRGQTILNQWANGGYGGEWVLSEGLNDPEFLQELSDITAGMYVASPDPEQTRGGSAFEESIGQANTLFAPHAYDALFLMALAIEVAGEASATAIAQNIRSVSRTEDANGTTTTEMETTTTTEAASFGAQETTTTTGTETGTETTTPPPGTVTVGEFDRAKELISQGEDINYQGASSPVDLNEALEPLNQFAILQVQDDGSLETLETIPRSFFEEGQ